MARKTPTDSTRSAQSEREDRLKAALKANLARRKAQSRARSEPKDVPENNTIKSGQEKDR